MLIFTNKVTIYGASFKSLTFIPFHFPTLAPPALPSYLSASALPWCDRFAAADIEVRPVWKPMHRQPLYTHCELLGGAVADRLEDTGLCLPSSSILTRNEQERVIGVFAER